MKSRTYAKRQLALAVEGKGSGVGRSLGVVLEACILVLASRVSAFCQDVI